MDDYSALPSHGRLSRVSGGGLVSSQAQVFLLVYFRTVYGVRALAR